MRVSGKNAKLTIRQASAMALAAVMACSLSFPSLAFAKVSVDEAELAQGEKEAFPSPAER